MTMLATSHLLQPDQSLFGVGDDFDNLYADRMLYPVVDVFDCCLEEGNEFCNSVSSSVCPSPSEVSTFDIGLEETLDAFLFDRGVDLTPSSPPKASLHMQRKNKNTPEDTKNGKNLCFTDVTNQKWSTLTSSKQQELLNDLMETVSQQFGLREQLDVIKIINPNARLLPGDTEFFIDFELMDDEKFTQVKLYVEQELKNQKRCGKQERHVTKTHDQSSYEKKEKHKLGHKMKDEKLKRMDRCKANHGKMTKRFKQLRKERKSGLFSREQVISVETSATETDGDDEEIDILT